MTAPAILLDPVDFDALHLSALEFGGIGAGLYFFPNDVPLCGVGHAIDLKEGVCDRICQAGLYTSVNDLALAAVGVTTEDQRVPFEQYIQLLNIDVKENV